MQNIGIYQLAKIINLHTHTDLHGERDNIHNNNKSIIAVQIQFVNQIHTPNTYTRPIHLHQQEYLLMISRTSHIVISMLQFWLSFQI